MAPKLIQVSHGHLLPKSRGVIEETPDATPPESRQYEDDSDMEEIEDEEEYEVERILSHSYENGQKYHLVKWYGYEDSSDWLPEQDLGGAQELVAEYNETLLRKKGKEVVC